MSRHLDSPNNLHEAVVPRLLLEDSDKLPDEEVTTVLLLDELG